MLQIPIVEAGRPVPVFEPAPGWARRDSSLPTILNMLEDPKYSASDVVRLISTEIAVLILELQFHGENPKARRRLRDFQTAIWMLQALGNFIQRVERFRQNNQLDFDGPKVTYIVKELLNCFNQAVEQVLGRSGAPTAHSLRLQLKYLLREKEPEIRRKVNGMR